MVNIQNRRYLGNKYKLLPFIEDVVLKHCPNANSLLDIFAGTGVVAYHFANRMRVMTSEILYSNYLSHIAFMGTDVVDEKKLFALIDEFNNVTVAKDNYMSETFGNTYFSQEDCRRIGYIRERIGLLKDVGKINEREFAILVTSLLYAMDKIANTCGHYDAYRKGVEYKTHLSMQMLSLDKKVRDSLFFLGDANEMVREGTIPYADIVYCDPPYNSRNYSDLYHVLENVARWDKPEVFGVARKMNRKGLKSRYCSREASQAFEELVSNLNCKYIILSYNNTGNRANARSNACMTDEAIMRILSKKGKVEVFTQKYKAFTTGKSNNKENEERLFLCTVKPAVKSPLNYTGGKHSLLPKIYPFFPKKIHTLIDLFCGGLNVGLNYPADAVIYNDNNADLINLLRFFKETAQEDVFRLVTDVIARYRLTDSSLNGYEFYGCDSSNGLAKVNKAAYLRLREDFNNRTEKGPLYYAMLYTLIVYGFNNQLRFNRKGKFNLPVGKRDFNKVLQQNLKDFLCAVHHQNNTFLTLDFRDFDLRSLKPGDYIYCDPPYLITTATYNEQDGWTETDARDLRIFLDKANMLGIGFGYNDVIEHKGKKNEALKEWMEKYIVYHLHHDYRNSSYHGKNKDEETLEVFITNVK